MELKRWYYAKKMDVPDYDSTKAALDELESLIEKIGERSTRHIEIEHYELEKQLKTIRTIRSDDNECMQAIARRLTALEAKVNAPLHCEPISCRNYEGIGKAKDAPEKPCNRCGGEGKLIGEYGMMSHADGTCPICEGTGKHPSDTCGNCKKAARWDAQSTFVVCYAKSNELEFRRVDTPGCSHHERREV